MLQLLDLGTRKFWRLTGRPIDLAGAERWLDAPMSDSSRVTEAWLAAADGADIEIEDCRWTPCYDCGVCPEMGTEIQIGPTGQKLLPLSVV